MKHLNDYRTFETQKFLSSKELVFMKGKFRDDTTIKDKNLMPEKPFTGCVITVMIYSDKDGFNEGETFTIKVEGVTEDYLKQFKMLGKITVYDVTKVSIYGTPQTISMTGKVKPINGNNN